MTTTTTTAPNFAPSYGPGPLNLDRRLATAYAVAGLPAPALVARAESALADEPTPEQVAARITAESLDATDEWLEESVAAMTRALTVEKVSALTGRYRETALKQAAGRYVAQAAQDLAPTFAKVATALGKAAPALPHRDPLAPAAVMDADATREWRAARQALAQLGALANIHEPIAADRVGMEPASLARVVEFPEITQAQPIDRLTRKPLGQVDARRTEVIEFARVAEREGVDLALIRVARGDWPSLSLSLPESKAALRTRVSHLEKALSQIAADSDGRVGQRRVVLA